MSLVPFAPMPSLLSKIITILYNIIIGALKGLFCSPLLSLEHLSIAFGHVVVVIPSHLIFILSIYFYINISRIFFFAMEEA